MQFEFATANRILFGPGVSAEIPKIVKSLGKSALLLTDSKDRVKAIINGIADKKFGVYLLYVRKEPDIKYVIMAMRMYKELNCDVVISIGGGSTIDAGKALASLITNPRDPLDYLDVIGTGHPIEKPSVPFIAVPTTAGTGSEATCNAVITIPEHHIKVSLRSPFLLPRVAVVDPELTYSLPPTLTASTGFDALTQLIEPYLCNSPTPLADIICREGILFISRSLLKAYHNGNDTKAREDMALASLYSGMALANARLGAVHGLAGCVGGFYSISHGSICAKLLPIVMATNLRALRTRQPGSPALQRYSEVAALLTGNRSAIADDAISFLYDLQEKLAIPSLGDSGIKPIDFPYLAAQAQKSSSMRGNPIQLNDKELIEILERSI